MKADIYPAGQDELNRWGLSHRQTIDLEGMHLVVAPPSYVIAVKLRYWSMSHQDKHLRDIRGMILVSSADLDVPLIERMADACGARSAWNACLSTPGEET